MKTEIVKIIEAGLAMDRKRVMSFAAVLASNLENEGDASFARRIRNVLANTAHPGLSSLDSIGVKPIDSESKLAMVDVTNPKVNDGSLVFDDVLRGEIDSFVNGYCQRDDLLLVGAAIPNTLLMYGPPGCGKTSAARLVAAKAHLPLVTARLDALVSSLLGSTAKNLRKVFEYASQMPCVLFLDEFDAVAKNRDDHNELGELKRVVNCLLQEMDAFSSDSILIAATNHDALLDKAIWRRFAKVLKFNAPGAHEIEQLIHLYLNGKDDGVFSSKAYFRRVVAALAGFSHADVRTVIMNALRGAVLEGRRTVSVGDVVRAAYLHRHHAIIDEDAFIDYLRSCGFSHRRMHNEFKIPYRKVRKQNGKISD